MDKWLVVDGPDDGQEWHVYQDEPDPKTGLVHFECPRDETSDNCLGDFDYDPELFRVSRYGGKRDWEGGDGKYSWTYRLECVGPAGEAVQHIPYGVQDLTHTFAALDIVDASTAQIPDTVRVCEGMFAGCDSLRWGPEHFPDGLEGQDPYYQCKCIYKGSDKTQEAAQIVMDKTCGEEEDMQALDGCMAGLARNVGEILPNYCWLTAHELMHLYLCSESKRDFVALFRVLTCQDFDALVQECACALDDNAKEVEGNE